LAALESNGGNEQWVMVEKGWKTTIKDSNIELRSVRYLAIGADAADSSNLTPWARSGTRKTYL